jgi:hypothetical protein
MGKKDTDKKLGRFSTILEIITNLGQIFTWVLGVGSAYVLNIQTKPIVVPGIDITLDLGFQFALLISAMLGYIHFLQKFWEKNKEKLKLSDSFKDFALWDLPRLRQPLLLIPIVIAGAIFIQVSIKSTVLLVLFVAILGVLCYFSYTRFAYYLSPTRKLEAMVLSWRNSEEWIERWVKRIRTHINLYHGVTMSSVFSIYGMKYNDDNLEYEVALGMYFKRYEFDEDLVIVTLRELHPQHPYYSQYNSDQILMPRKNLSLRKPS